MTTEQIREEMIRVSVQGEGLATIALAVASLNETLAHHAAWTEERFEAQDARFEAIDRRFEQVDRRFEQVDRRFDAVEFRLSNLESGQVNILTRVVDLEETQKRVLSTMLDLSARVGDLERGQGLILCELRDMSAHMQHVFNFAVRAELRVDEINE